MTEEIPICDVCEQKMVPLPHHTLRKNLPVYVCDKPHGKAKTPCDGPLFEIATKNA